MEVARGTTAQAAPGAAPPPIATTPQAGAGVAPAPLGLVAADGRPLRVQSVLRGPTEASCLQQAVADGQQAAANGYAPVWQTWGRDAQGVTLTIVYDLVPPVAAAAPAWAAPAAAPQPTPVYQPPPPAAAAPAAPAYQPAPPPATVWAPPPPVAAPPPATAPPASGPTPGSVASALGSRIVRFVVVFAIAFIVWYIYYSLDL